MTRETMSSNHPPSLQIRTEILDRVSMGDRGKKEKGIKMRMNARGK